MALHQRAPAPTPQPPDLASVTGLLLDLRYTLRSLWKTGTIALIALSIAGVAILTLSSGEQDLAGQVKRQQQLNACALAGTDVAIASLPATSSTSFTVEPQYTTGAGHHAGTSANPTIGIVPTTLAGDLPLRSAGENIVNMVRPASLGSGGTS